MYWLISLFKSYQFYILYFNYSILGDNNSKGCQFDFGKRHQKNLGYIQNSYILNTYYLYYISGNNYIQNNMLEGIMLFIIFFISRLSMA